ncbi:MAG: ABC transporter permease [Chloroflexi bacterium]|nr:ABC transporter permease [Chloroflexota bacterium]MYD49272.1 ABC transporter permease [Chloroflexota bacterium]
MTNYLLRRSGQMVLTLFLIVTLAFFLVQAQPGDYAAFYSLNPDIPAEAREQIKASFGLDKPLWQQYLIHMKNTLTGNFGVSFGHYPRPVIEVLAERLPRTIVLFLSATAVSFYLGFFLGKAIAWRRGGVLEYAATISGATLFTAFTPAFALMMIWIFAFKLGWLPVGKFLDPLIWRGAEVTANHVFSYMLATAAAFVVFAFLTLLVARKSGRFATGRLPFLIIAAGAVAIPVAWAFTGIGYLALDILRHMILPIATLTLISFAGTMLLTRNSMLETMREDYVMAARAKGLPEKVVRDRHAARNALLPVITSLVYSLIFAIDGSVIIEGVFSWPGTGMTLLQAVRSEDLPLVMGAMVFIGLFSLLAHVIVDVLYVYLDPRIRYQ